MSVPTTEPREQRLTIRDLSWDSYRQIAQALTGRHVRLTYDRGSLEFMTISAGHANLSRLFAQFVYVLTEELGLPRKSCGDMTCDREDLDRGLEPDECFYIANESAVRAKDELQLGIDPPPDLAIEIELSPASRRRLPVYEALGVPELWRYDGKALAFLGLTDEGAYASIERSRSFPSLAPTDLQAFLDRRSQTDETSLIRSFREWVREHVVGAEGA